MINLKYDFAEALTQAYRRLKTAVAETQDQEDRLIKSSLLPEHVHFLVSTHLSDLTILMYKVRLLDQLVQSPRTFNVHVRLDFSGQDQQSSNRVSTHLGSDTRRRPL